MLLPAWSAACRAFDGRKVLLVWPVARVARRWMERLRTLGCPPPFVLGLHDGEGAPLNLPVNHHHILTPGTLPPHTPGDRLFDRFQAAVSDLPADAMAAIHAWDPEGEAVVITPAAATLESVAGRRVYGRTPAIRAQLEDKTTIDSLFASLGIAVAPHVVVPLAHAAAAASRLDAGEGTVWAGDNTTTIEAGAHAVVRVHTPQSHALALDRFHGRCARVRVQPFLAGTPCSIQGICTPTGVALTRPTEMLVLHNPLDGGFLLAGMSTTWDPPPPVTQALRTIGRTVGQHLQTAFHWRGGFSVDAIAAPDGTVWPTELNARMSAGLALVDGCLPGPSLELMERLLREGIALGLTAARLETWMERPLAARRMALVRVHGVPAPAQRHDLPIHGEPPQPVTSGHAPDAVLSWSGPPGRGVVELAVDPVRLPRGTRLGPRVAQALQLAAETWDLPLGPWASA